MEICETATLALPLLVRVNVCDCCAPMVTLPKASLDGLEPRSPCELALPVPDSESVVELSLASLETVAVAVNAPAAFGVKLTTTGTLCPAATLMGIVGETRLKYLLEMETLLTFTAAGPELVAVTVRDLLLPACTLPNCNAAVFSDRVDVC